MPEWYGPWQESRIHEEIIYGRVMDPAEEHEDNVAVLLGEAPTQRSGWTVQVGRSYDVSASAGDEVPGGLDDPPPPHPPLSSSAFVAALNAPVTDGYTMQHDAKAFGSRHQPSVGKWVRSHGWELAGVQYEMDYPGFPESAEHEERLAVPPGFPVSTDDYTVQLEHYTIPGSGNLRPILLDAEVLPLEPPLAFAGLYVKDAGLTNQWLHLGPTSIIGTQLAHGGPGPLDVGVMQELVDTITDTGGLPGEPDTLHAPEMPKMAVLWNADPLSTALFGPSEVIIHEYGSEVAVRIQWRLSRWRQVFFDGPPVTPDPYRRIFPRDDGLGVGGLRNYPRSKARQSSNRNAGGYL